MVYRHSNHILICPIIVAMLVIILPVLPVVNITSAWLDDDTITNDELVNSGHEIGTHGTKHIDTSRLTLDQMREWAERSVSDIEGTTARTSRWDSTCLSISYPFSSTNYDVQLACYNAGLRIGGQNYRNQAIGAFWDSNEPPENDFYWLNINRTAGKASKGHADVNLLADAESKGSLADAMLHGEEQLDEDFMNYLDRSSTVWRATWGEVRSYCGHSAGITLTQVNTGTLNGTKLYRVTKAIDMDPRLWDVPVTLMFRLSGSTNNFTASFIGYGSHGSKQIYLDNISGVQSMQPGYRWAAGTLYLSVLTSDTLLLLDERLEYAGPAKWWNGLNWTSVIHVDDIRSQNFMRVFKNYNETDHLQPLTFMVNGRIQWPLTNNKPILDLIKYGCVLGVIIAITAAAAVWYRTSKADTL